jgi:hypothetical protein
MRQNARRERAIGVSRSRRGGFVLVIAALALSLSAPGCSHVEVVGSDRLQAPGQPGNDPDCTWYLASDVWGYLLFGKVPLVSGDIDHPGTLAWFRTTTNLEGCIRLVEDAAGPLGADELREVHTDILSQWVFLGFWLPEARATAVATRRPALHALPPLEPPAPRVAQRAGS